VPRSFKKKSGYLPGLDGLRAIAIAGVLLTHDLPWTILGHSDAAWKGYGGWGVQLFFAISGVLICWRLLEDEAKQREVRLGAFYTRRLLRIQPAALSYLAVIAILFGFGLIPTNWVYWTSAVFSFTNFLITAHTPPGAAAFLGHFWTLAVEEHFYIVLSLLFLAARKRRAVWLGGLLLLLIVGQQIAAARDLFTPVVSERRSYWVIQLLLFPALLALCIYPQRIRKLAEKYLRPWVVFAGLTAAISIQFLLHGFTDSLKNWNLDSFMSQISGTVWYGFAFVVIAIMLHPASLTTRLLESRPLRFAGRISYSLYLWHILFFIPVYLPDQIHSSTLMMLTARPWKYVATAVCALLSYYLIERPFIRLGHRLAPPATEGHRDLETREGSIGGLVQTP
jgi:peptidoglycan/LPS O-acetylase OafA/YrhL